MEGMDISTGKDKPRTRGSRAAEAEALSISGLHSGHTGTDPKRPYTVVTSPLPPALPPARDEERGTQRLRNRSHTE